MQRATPPLPRKNSCGRPLSGRTRACYSRHVSHRDEGTGITPRAPAGTDPEVLRILADAAGPHRDIPLARQVFVNRNLRMDKIDLVGFDMDYTLAVYQLQQMERLSFELTAARMVEAHGYPQGFLSLEYDPLFVIRGLVVDKPFGNIFKMDRHNHVGRCYRGRRALRFDDVKPLYRDEKIHLSSPRFHWIDTFFALPEACLFAAAVAHFDAGGESFDPRRASGRISPATWSAIPSWDLPSTSSDRAARSSFS
jgi:5'-nucleotidase